jgi:hypothetical protein
MLKKPQRFNQKYPRNTFINVARYKINIQKSAAFLYTNNEQAEKEIRRAIPFTITPKKDFGINLTKEVKDLCNESYKNLKKEIKKIRRWKDLPCSRIRINFVQMAILSKAIYRFKCNAYQNPNIISAEIEKSILKFIWKNKRPQIPKAIQSKKSKLEIPQYQSSNYTAKP